MNNFLRTVALAGLNPIPTAYLWIAVGVAMIVGGFALIYALVRRKDRGGPLLIIGGVFCLVLLVLGIYLLSIGVNYST